MMNIRTDLAVESFSAEGLPDGVHRHIRGESFEITEIIIDNDDSLETLGKGKGRYITLEGNSLSRFSDDYEDMACELADELKRLVPEGEMLVVGLGNNDITPDALGPQVTAKSSPHVISKASLTAMRRNFLLLSVP